jgi:hypothetical protein
MESDATVRGQLVPHGLALASLAFIAADAGMASSHPHFFQPPTGAMSADEYRAQCVLQARVGLGLLAGAATGVDATGPSLFSYERRTQDEISALCSRLMDLVQHAPIEARDSMALRLPTRAPSYM